MSQSLFQCQPKHKADMNLAVDHVSSTEHSEHTCCMYEGLVIIHKKRVDQLFGQC